MLRICPLHCHRSNTPAAFGRQKGVDSTPQAVCFSSDLPHFHSQAVAEKPLPTCLCPNVTGSDHPLGSETATGPSGVQDILGVCSLSLWRRFYRSFLATGSWKSSAVVPSDSPVRSLIWWVWGSGGQVSFFWESWFLQDWWMKLFHRVSYRQIHNLTQQVSVEVSCSNWPLFWAIGWMDKRDKEEKPCAATE